MFQELNSVLTHPAQWKEILSLLQPAPFELWQHVKEELDFDYDEYVKKNNWSGFWDNNLSAILPRWASGYKRLTNKKCFTRAAELKTIMDKSVDECGASDFCAVGIASRVADPGYHEWLLLFYKYSPQEHIMPPQLGNVAFEGIWRYNPWKPVSKPEMYEILVRVE